MIQDWQPRSQIDWRVEGVEAFAALDAGRAAAINIQDHKLANDPVAQVFPHLPK